MSMIKFEFGAGIKFTNEEYKNGYKTNITVGNGLHAP